MDLDHTSVESIDNTIRELSLNESSVENTASSIAHSSIKTRSQKISIYGNCRKPRNTTEWNNDIDTYNLDFHTNIRHIQLNPEKYQSVYLEGLEDSVVEIPDKVKYVMVIDCSNLIIKLEKSTIGGIDFLRSKGVKIISDSGVMPYIGVEYSNEIYLKCIVNTDTLLFLHHSMEVQLNDKRLQCNPFNSIEITHLQSVTRVNDYPSLSLLNI